MRLGGWVGGWTGGKGCVLCGVCAQGHGGVYTGCVWVFCCKVWVLYCIHTTSPHYDTSPVHKLLYNVTTCTTLPRFPHTPKHITQTHHPKHTTQNTIMLSTHTQKYHPGLNSFKTSPASTKTPRTPSYANSKMKSNNSRPNLLPSSVPKLQGVGVGVVGVL